MAHVQAWPQPSFALLRFEAERALDGGDFETGELWLHWVGLNDSSRVEEFFPIASLG